MGLTVDVAVVPIIDAFTDVSIIDAEGAVSIICAVVVVSIIGAVVEVSIIGAVAEVSLDAVAVLVGAELRDAAAAERGAQVSDGGACVLSRTH